MLCLSLTVMSVSFTDCQLITIVCWVKYPLQVALSVKSISDINGVLCPTESDTCFMQKISFQRKEKKQAMATLKENILFPCQQENMLPPYCLLIVLSLNFLRSTIVSFAHPAVYMDFNCIQGKSTLQKKDTG